MTSAMASGVAGARITGTREALRVRGFAEVEWLTASWENSRATLFRRCLCWTKGNARDAEDLLSDAYVRALEAALTSRIVIDVPLKWWATIIANLGRDRYRRARRRLQHETMDIPPTDVPDRKANLEQVVSAKQHLERTLRAMDGLTCTHRLALAYRGAGEGYPEIARRLGMSAENARKVVQVARGALRGAANDVAT